MNTQKNYNPGRPISTEDLRRIVTDPNEAELAIRHAEDLGKRLAKPLSTSQIRSLFGEVRMIQGEWQLNAQKASRRLLLLKPKMAYRAKKESGRGVEDLVSVLSPAIDYVGNDAGNFQRFVEFFEAILAYHKANGGK